MAEVHIRKYDESIQEKWDQFVLQNSINGTFLQTRRFLNYHGSRFKDASIIFYKGQDTIVAVIPACDLQVEGHRIFSAHCGSTFGGIIVGEQFNNIEHMVLIMEALDCFLKSEKYDEVQLKCTGRLFAKKNTDLLFYLLFQRGYSSYEEISFYIDFDDYNEDIPSNYSASRRRGYRHSLKYELQFREIEREEEIGEFYNILCKTLKKYDTVPVHTLDELLDFKQNTLREEVAFYGVYHDTRMIAGSMVFKFDNSVFHTQYFAADPEYLYMFPMNYLDTQLIREAREKKFKYFSFGISTEEKGKILNKSLAQFKEGFGTKYTLNRTYFKVLS